RVRHFWHFLRGARRPRAVRETGRSKPSEQQEPQARFACDVDRRLRTVGKNAFPPRPLAVGGREAAGGASTRSAQARAAKRLEARGHAQKASAAPEHRAAKGE